MARITCKECEYSGNVDGMCETCSRFYNDNFRAKVIPKGCSRCYSCGRVFPTSGPKAHIFPLKKDPREGLCFDCY